jgi:cytochrome c551/c552
MISWKPNMQKPQLILFLLFSFSGIKIFAQDGQALFMSKCANCHASNMKSISTGPALAGVEQRWEDKGKLHEWIRNNVTLTQSGYPRAVEISQFAPSEMSAFPSLTDPEIDAILAFINKKANEVPIEDVANEGGTQKESNQNAIIFGVISLILAIIAFILMQVNSNLKKMSDDVEGIQRPDPVPFYRNKVYITIVSLIFFVIGGYYVTKGAIGLQRQKNYQPKQPVYYSHKIHAGINQINCLYCHGNAWESKSAAIPSVNVCMNCHKTITEYTKGPKLYDENGEEIDGTAEIQKLYEYAGFDPKKPNDWNPSKAKPIVWERIHNLPDHVYFNHSQHIRAGKVQCQTCHGEIQNMDEVKQFSELSMGWCINCHRQSKVDFNYDNKSGNKFYSIYEKFHNDIKAGKMDSVTVENIGGLECQKCHY